MDDPAELQHTLQRIRQWVVAERRQAALERHWAKRLGLVFGLLIGVFLLALLLLFAPW